MIIDAILLGIIEGLTEFIPVSSTGHLILLSSVLGFEFQNKESFEIFIQLGAILAVMIIYWENFLQLFKPSNGGFSGKNGIIKISLGCLPAFLIGPLFYSYIKTYLFNPFTVAIGLFIGGIILIALEKDIIIPKTSSLKDITYTQAFKIGLFQVVSLWPGMSRSASTIIGGIAVGLDKKTSCDFSFILSVPVISAAVAFDLLHNISAFNSANLPIFAVGFIVSFIVGYASIKWFLKIIKNTSLAPFGWYRVLLAILIGIIWIK